MGGKRQKSGEMRAGSRVLVQIIALIVVVFIAFGLASFLFFRNAQNRLIQKSKDKLVENEVELISSTNGYMVDLMIQIQLLSTPGAAPESINNDLRTGIESGTVTPSQHIVNDMLQSMIKNGLFNNKLAFFTTTPVSGGDPVIVMSSDDKYMYEQLPPDLVRLAETGEGKNTRDEGRFNSENSYLLEEDGFPEYGLENEYLVTSYQYKSESGEENLWYFSFSSMHDELAAIDTFYRNERRSVNLLLALVLGGSIIALI
ncbi:MAG: hypothetical protein JW738_00460, partial [Actinobacteria bacterium]|nr:hypothetical protein [Actinomycetota bacterium]